MPTAPPDDGPLPRPDGRPAATVSAQLRAHLQDRLTGRRVVLVTELLAGATRRVVALRDLGVLDVLVVASGTGTGELPPPDVARVVVEGPKPATVTDQVAGWTALAQDPTFMVRRAVQEFDPAGGALCLLGPFAPAEEFCGREAWGGRPADVAVLEDKTRSDELFAAAGVLQAEHRIVPAFPEDLARAAAALDVGDGTVWSADASSGLNGNGDRVRWVRTSDDVVQATELMRACASRVRVMPFLDGVPCSIHGFVLPRPQPGGRAAVNQRPGCRDVAVFRPVEQVVLRSPESSRFVYAGLSTYWDPSPDDREQMRAAARAVGLHLAASTSLLGGYSVDGILTRDGFRPTEVNPRFSGGLGAIANGVPDLPIELLQRATVRGVDLGITAAELEETLLRAADHQRFGSAYCASSRRSQSVTVTVLVAGGPDELSVATSPATADGAVVSDCGRAPWRQSRCAPSSRPGVAARAGAPEPLGTLECGPSPLGALPRFTPAPGALPLGARMAPYAVAALRLADQLWDTGFGSLEAAPDLR